MRKLIEIITALLVTEVNEDYEALKHGDCNNIPVDHDGELHTTPWGVRSHKWPWAC